MLVLVVFTLFIVLFFLNQLFRRPAFYPPGPRPLPVVGNLFSVALELRKFKYYHLVWRHWTQIYGNVLGLKLGCTNIVIVSGKDLIREVLTREAFEGRPDGFYYVLRSFGKKLGLVFNDGPLWASNKRIVLKYLKHFGYNTRCMENYINEECQYLIKLRLKDAGRPVLINDMFQITIINILWRLVAGKRYDLEDEELKTIGDLIARLFKTADMSGGLLNFMPFIRHIAPELSGYNEHMICVNNIQKFLREMIEVHKQSLDVNNPKDLIDALLIERMDKNNDAISDEDLLIICLDLIEAGMETVSSTTVFILLHIIRNDAVQKLLHEEIDHVIGSSRGPTLNDRARMVYTEAVLLESLRISSVAPVGVPHMALEDARVANYIIPKGTFILFGMYDLHHDEHWKDPYIFRPERFITKDGNLIQDEWLLPFGTGRRRCIGEGMARSEMFLILTNLLQKFRLKIPEGDPLPSTQPNEGLTLSAKPFRLIFEPRI